MEGLKNRDAVVDFLIKHVIGKTVRASKTALIPDAGIRVSLRREATYCGLDVTPTGLCFDVLLTIRQRNQDISGSKKIDRSGQEHNFDRRIVVRCELLQKRSTGELVGIERIISNSLGDYAGSANSVRMSLCETGLLQELSTVMYGDHSGSSGRFYPGALDITHRFLVENDKLTVHTTEVDYRVNPESMARIATGNSIVIISKEVVDK